MNCQTAQANLSAYLHGELPIDELQELHGHLATCDVCIREELALRQTQQVLGQYREMPLPLNFETNLTKKIQRLQNKKQINLLQIISTAAAAILLTLGIQYMIASAEPPELPAHYSIFQKSQAGAEKENVWAERIIDKLSAFSYKNNRE
jgi:anti-sigma factor RsiW